MDKSASWRVTRQYAKTAAEWTAAESDRRKALRAERKPLVADAARARSAARAAHSSALAADPKGTNRATHKAARELKRAERDHARAKRRVPSTLPVFAAKTVATLGVAGYLGFPLVPAEVWDKVVFWGCVALVAAVVVGTVWFVVAAKLRPAPAFEPTAEEKAILARLQPEHWTEHAEVRGLGGTVTARPELSASGITVQVRLDGKWTPGKLADAEGNVRALLGCRTALRIEIRAGDKGGWAVITLRTRLAADGAVMNWTPNAVGIGLDTVTGQPVEIPLDNRLTVAGASGSGKSWSSRPHMARAHLLGDLVFVDGKGEEATIWAGVCRCAVEPEEIRQTVAEVHAEMNRRKADMKRRGLSVWDGRQLTLFVDEGRVILALKDKRLIQMLIDISALGRSRGVVLWWATQYPVTSGDAPGIHAQIAANTDSRFALRVKNLTHATVALDDDADYGPHLIEASKKMRGYGYLGGHGPNLIRTWTMTDAMVKALPANRWQAPAAPAAPVVPPMPTYAPAVPAATNWDPGQWLSDWTEVTRPAPQTAEHPAGLRLVKDDDFHLAPPAQFAPAAAAPVVPEQGGPAAEGADAKVLEALRLLRPPVRQKDIVDQSGLPKSTVSRTVKRLVETGVLVREADGTVAIKAIGEVSA